MECWEQSQRPPFPRSNLGPEIFGACGGDGGPDWYEPEPSEYEMPPEGTRIFLAEAMHWTLDYGDNLELRERLEIITALNARRAAQISRLHQDD